MSEKRSNFTWILSELPQLHGAGIISDDAKNALENHYRSKLESLPSPQKIFTLVIGIIGVVLISAGIILFLNHNWDMFPKAVRIGIAFAPLLPAAIISYVTIAGERSGLWRETSAVLTAVGSAAVIAMLSQIYHINGEFSDYVFLVLLLAAPALYIFNSIGLAVLYVFFGFFFWTWDFTCSWKALTVLLLFLPFLFYHLQKDTPYRTGCRYLALAVAFQGLLNGGVHYYAPLPWGIICSILVVSGCDLLRKKTEFVKNPWFTAGFFAQILLLALCSSDEHFFRFSSKFQTGDLWIYWGFTGLIAILWIRVFLQYRLTPDRVLCGVMILFTLVPFVTREPVMRLLFNGYFAIAGIAYLRAGFVKRSLLLFNTGVLMLAILGACRFFDSNIGVLYRSAGFLLLGIGFIIANAVYLKRRANA